MPELTAQVAIKRDPRSMEDHLLPVVSEEEDTFMTEDTLIRVVELGLKTGTL